MSRTVGTLAAVFEFYKNAALNLPSMVSPFDRALHDTGKRYQGHPVFHYRGAIGHGFNWPLVYRYTPVNSERSALAWVPDGAELT